jgi:hypothetical protein
MVKVSKVDYGVTPLRTTFMRPEAERPGKSRSVSFETATSSADPREPTASSTSPIIEAEAFAEMITGSIP